MPIWECVHHLLLCATPLFVHFKGYTKMADMFTKYKKNPAFNAVCIQH